MHLTPLEWQKLKESWDIARIGADVYYKRKSVESFICNFPERPAKDFCGCSFTPDVTYTENRADCISLTSQQHINYYVHQMLLSEADRVPVKFSSSCNLTTNSCLIFLQA